MPRALHRLGRGGGVPDQQLAGSQPAAFFPLEPRPPLIPPFEDSAPPRVLEQTPALYGASREQIAFALGLAFAGSHSHHLVFLLPLPFSQRADQYPIGGG